MEAPLFGIEAIGPRLVVRCRCRACSMLPPGRSLARVSRSVTGGFFKCEASNQGQSRGSVSVQRSK